jgi:NAD(P)H-dependent FMN reductase
MSNRILVLYGSYRTDRKGIRLAEFAMGRLRARGEDVELIDAKAIDLPMLDRMLKEYATGTAPAALETLGAKIRHADAFLFVVGEYNWGMQPGLKNLTDHFLEEWFWRPAAIASYSAGRLSGTRSSYAWHNTLSEMGMVVISSTLTVGPITETLNAAGEPIGEPVRRSWVRFPTSRMIWRGGRKPRKPSGLDERRPTEARRYRRSHPVRCVANVRYRYTLSTVLNVACWPSADAR